MSDSRSAGTVPGALPVPGHLAVPAGLAGPLSGGSNSKWADACPLGTVHGKSAQVLVKLDATRLLPEAELGLGARGQDEGELARV
jgi:hypothetical protein